MIIYYPKSIEGMGLLIRGTALMIIWHSSLVYHANSLLLLYVKKVINIPNNLVAMWIRFALNYFLTYD